MFLPLLDNSSILGFPIPPRPPSLSTVPWDQWLYTIAYIYELSQDLRTFTIEYPGACLSLLHCLEASLHRRFHFIEKNWCLHPPCAGMLFLSCWLSQPLPARRFRGVPAGGAAASLAARSQRCLEGVSQSPPTFCTRMDCSPEVPLPKVFSRREYWNGLPFPSPGDLPTPGIELGSPAL